MEEMEQRWGFMIPWCHELHDLIDINLHGVHGGMFANTGRVPNLHVQVSTQRCGRAGLVLMEALKLMAAVAHVDNSAWAYLLMKHCGAFVGRDPDREFEEHVSARFLLELFLEGRDNERTATYQDVLVLFLGVDQFRNPSDKYVEALARIAALDSNSRPDKPGIDLKIPIRVYFRMYRRETSGGVMEEHADIRKAEKRIKREWETFERTSEDTVVRPGAMRCRFVLEPMIASYERFKISSELVQALDSMVARNVWFSQVMLSMAIKPELLANSRALKKVLGQLMSRLFDSARRSPALANTNYLSTFSSIQEQKSQLGTVQLCWQGSPRTQDFEAMCSALVRNQTTKKLQVSFKTNWLDVMLARHFHYPIIAISAHLWKWLAYALFSKRARACSSLESISLRLIGRMCMEDVDEILAIIESDHPEELLCGLPRGVTEEKEAMLTSGAPVRWQFDAYGQPATDSRPISFPSPIPFVLAFSDDGESGWVDVMVPGLGRCQVQRDDLVFYDAQTRELRSRCLRSFTLGFQGSTPSDVAGLLRLLAAVGASLRYLEIGGVNSQVNIAKILECCPKLDELALSGDTMSAQFIFSEMTQRRDLNSGLEVDWGDVVALSGLLSDASGPVAKSLRKLHLNFFEGDYSARDGRHFSRLDSELQTLARMLNANSSLERFEVVLTAKHQRFAADFERHHLEPINRGMKLSTGTKSAFLSVISLHRTASVKSKKTKLQVERNGSAIGELDQLVLLNIFTFAAPPVLRHVYFRMIPYRDDDGVIVDRE